MRKCLWRIAETFPNHRKFRRNGGPNRIERSNANPNDEVTCNLDVHVSVQQQVLGLEVPVDDVTVVAVLHRRQDLPELPPCLDLA